MRMTAKEIELATGGKIVWGEASAAVCGVSTDTRADCQNMLFIPLVGANFDGHGFIAQAFDKGASVALASRLWLSNNNALPVPAMSVPASPAPAARAVIEVPDTLAALGRLAAWYRLKFSPLVVAVTGSVGKTTTKEMIALVLSKKYNVLKSGGNFNNEIGLPLTLFGLKEEHTALVLEMGMSAPGEIARLSRIARPDVAVITNIGYAHIEKLGSKQNILKAKLEIVEGMSKNGSVYLNGDDTLLKGLMGLVDRPLVYYGIDDGLDVVGTGARMKGGCGLEFDFVWQRQNYAVTLDAAGEHNIHNALAAVAIGLQHGVPPGRIIEALREFRPGDRRMNVTGAGGIKIIDDTYNASLQSMEAALDVLAGLEVAGRRVAVLGDMLELGDYSKELHAEVGAYAAQKGVDLLIAAGAMALDVTSGALAAAKAAGRAGLMECRAFESRDDALRFATDKLAGGDAVLVKGSRGMAMEHVVEGLLRAFERADA